MSKPNWEDKLTETEKKMAMDWSSPKNWRAWGSWFSWGSPVGLGLFFVLLAIAKWIFLDAAHSFLAR